MNAKIPVEYINTNFLPDDNLAVVLIHKAAGEVTQRITSAGRVASEPFQAWLRYMNREHFEVYLSVNTLRERAQGRTKADVAEIRHVYFDFDERGDEGVRNLRSRADLPEPNHLLQTSPGRWQAIWKVQGFVKGQDEVLMQGLVHELGADKAVHDSARVLRLPGFYNHKYEAPHLVTVQNLARETYDPRQFPQYQSERVSVAVSVRDAPHPGHHRVPDHLS
ncbi:MAG: DNA-primase RepB domain-containing protein, partial [Bryobacteraceae bacterium]